jgi:hypothetical protein
MDPLQLRVAVEAVYCHVEMATVQHFVFMAFVQPSVAVGMQLLLVFIAFAVVRLLFIVVALHMSPIESASILS